MSSDQRGPYSVRPMLSGSDDLNSGYVRLQNLESKYTYEALKHHIDQISLWYRALALLVEIAEQEHSTELTEQDREWLSWSFRLRLVGTAAASAKLALDAALAGYYSQSYAVIRHLLETWRIMIYLRLIPNAAWNWIPAPDSGKAQPPNSGTISSGIRKTGSHAAKTNLEWVNDAVKQCDFGAHPTILALTQVETGKFGHLQLGANYRMKECTDVLGMGVIAIMMVLEEAGRNTHASDSWRQQFHKFTEDQSALHETLFPQDSN